MRVLVGGIGYRNLRDHSAGVAASDRLALRAWPEHVVVEDISYNPIALVQRLEAEPPERRFSRALVVAGVARGGRPPGTVRAYRWDGVLPPDEEIQRAVSEAVTGIIALDNTLVVGRYFEALPKDVVVVEVEPTEVPWAGEAFGAAFSPAVAAAFDPLCDLVERLALDDARTAELPLCACGGAAHVRADP